KNDGLIPNSEGHHLAKLDLGVRNLAWHFSPRDHVLVSHSEETNIILGDGTTVVVERHKIVALELFQCREGDRHRGGGVCCSPQKSIGCKLPSTLADSLQPTWPLPRAFWGHTRAIQILRVILEGMNTIPIAIAVARASLPM